MALEPQLRCEVAYALTGRQHVVSVVLHEGATVSDAIAASGLRASCPELAHTAVAYGVFGRVVDETYALRDGDRVEIYRALTADPRTARRSRAARERR
jgi:putative ubiquitin-RnfH superfamily antitoxin RatB of RatAB toxin-antitoxin module